MTVTPETPRAQCRCGHLQMMHPFGCMACDCREFDKVETPRATQDVETMCDGNGECFRAWEQLDKALLRAEKAEAELSSLRSQVETVRDEIRRQNANGNAGHRMLARWADLLSAALGKDSQ